MGNETREQYRRVRPFRALVYDPQRVGSLADVIAPPYDAVGPEEIRRLHERHPYNVIRLILNQSQDPYAGAAQTLDAWIREGVLRRDPTPALYWYVQDFRLPDGTAHTRRGVMAAVRLERFESGRIRPHERTFPKAKADRLALLRACKANLSPVFGIHPSRSAALERLQQVETTPPCMDLVDDAGERHRVWRVTSPEVIRDFDRALADEVILIADGHHRYETALTWSEERRAAGENDPQAPHNFILMYLASMHSSGLVILPTHRIVVRGLSGSASEWLGRLREYFDVTEAAGERELLDRLGQEKGTGRIGACFHGWGRPLLLRLREPERLAEWIPQYRDPVRSLDTTVVDALVLGRGFGMDKSRAAQAGDVTHTPDAAVAVGAVKRGEAQACFLVRPPDVEDVRAACLAGQTMPEKSTYFYPKLLSGLVIRPLWDGG